MEMADYWIIEKQYIHKLFKVLVPRFQNCQVSYTRMYKAPQEFPGPVRTRAVLELRGHPYPSLRPDLVKNRNFIQNVLLDEAKSDYRREKYAEFAEKLAPMGDAELELNAQADENKRVEQLNTENVTNGNVEGKSSTDDSKIDNDKK